jgi:hypothetical protein|uniref:AAA ATPase AAA+ lid domain-containing protein n=1 Tax=Eutreptiella gymnastica TaxID=73025 RepID=A0A7S4FXS5_9EUGL
MAISLNFTESRGSRLRKPEDPAPQPQSHLAETLGLPLPPNLGTPRWQVPLQCVAPGRTSALEGRPRLQVPLPDADAIQAILRVCACRMPVSPDVDLGQWAPRLQGFSGAEIENMCREAALSALRRAVLRGPGGSAVGVPGSEGSLDKPSVHPKWARVTGNRTKKAVCHTV